VGIDRPETVYNDAAHSYTLEGERLLGVSTVAKIGGAESAWGTASAWGYKVGWRGALAVLSGDGGNPLASAYTNDGKSSSTEIAWPEQEALYQELKSRGLTPWSTRDKAADRGTWVHDVLEQLAQDGTVPNSSSWGAEIQGHVKAVYSWYLQYCPTFVATEVQVTSREHKFAGRYDIRCRLAGWDGALCLVDLKTSKGVYPTTHFPQLAGYELASVEMGFPPTDAQFVLNTHPDGTFNFVQSWSEPEDFLAYLGALKAIRRIEAEDPAVKLKLAREEALLAKLPGVSRDLAQSVPECAGMDARGVGILLGGLRKRGLVLQDGARWSIRP